MRITDAMIDDIMHLFDVDWLDAFAILHEASEVMAKHNRSVSDAYDEALIEDEVRTLECIPASDHCPF